MRSYPLKNFSTWTRSALERYRVPSKSSSATKGIQSITRRSLDTIREAAEYFGLPIRTDERLREREAAPGGNVRELFRKRWADFDWHEPGGECLRSVQERNIAALAAMGLVSALTHRAMSTSSL